MVAPLGPLISGGSRWWSTSALVVVLAWAEFSNDIIHLDEFIDSRRAPISPARQQLLEESCPYRQSRVLIRAL